MTTDITFCANLRNIAQCDTCRRNSDLLKEPIQQVSHSFFDIIVNALQSPKCTGYWRKENE